MARGHQGGLQQQKQGEHKAGRSLRMRAPEAQACARPDPGLPASTGDETLSVLLQPQAPGPPSTHIGAPPPAHSRHGEELPLDSLLLTTHPWPLLCHPRTGPRIPQLLLALGRATAPRLLLQGRLWSHPPGTSSPLGCSAGRGSSQTWLSADTPAPGT